MKYHYHIIYLIENIITHKKYVGKHSTNNLDDNYFGGGVYLNRSIKKYGKENFRKKILELCNESNINEKEIYWIEKKNSIKPGGYNLTIGGDGGNTFDLLSENAKKQFRQKISKIHKGRKRSNETKARMKFPKSEEHREKLKGPKSEEHRGKLKESWIERRKIPVSEETRRKISEAGIGEKRSDECKHKIGQANSKRIWKEESKEKIRKSRIGSKHSEKTLEKISKKYKCKYCDVKMNAGNLNRYHNENCKFK